MLRQAERRSAPPGMINLGNSCYLGATLQVRGLRFRVYKEGALLMRPLWTSSSPLAGAERTPWPEAAGVG